MEPDDFLRARIPGYAGLSDAQGRRLADEQVRAYVGERLAALRDGSALPESDQTRLERLMLRAQFANQQAFHGFDAIAGADQIETVTRLDADLIAAAEDGNLEALEETFDRRDEAMQKK